MAILFGDDPPEGGPPKPRWLELAAELEVRPVDKRKDERPPPAAEPPLRLHAPLKLAPSKKRRGRKLR